MFSNNLKEGRGSHTPASPRQQHSPPPLPEIPHITSDIQGPPAQRVSTPKSPQPSSPQDPKLLSHEARHTLQTPAQRALSPASQSHSGSRKRPPSSGPAPTPGRQSRIEVVLNVSPFKPVPGQARFYDVDDLEDELVATNVASKKRGSKQAALSALQNSTPATASAPVTPAGPLTTGKRPRGRPKGWRPGMPSTKTGLLTASAFKYLDKDGKLKVPAPPVPKSTGAKRRGRPPRSPSPTPRGVWEKLVTPPQYVPFLCEWAGCKAELQNVETLRRHIRVVHGRADPLICRWTGCAVKSPVFTQDYEFQHHVDEKHLVPFVWHVGDGQRNSKFMVKQEKDADQVPAYLFGANGEQVTPSVRNQGTEDFLTWRENRRRLRRILMQRDANAPSEDEEVDDEEDDEQTHPA